jgi:hypothetical protein
MHMHAAAGGRAAVDAVRMPPSSQPKHQPIVHLGRACLHPALALNAPGGLGSAVADMQLVHAGDACAAIVRRPSCVAVASAVGPMVTDAAYQRLAGSSLWAATRTRSGCYISCQQCDATAVGGTMTVGTPFRLTAVQERPCTFAGLVHCPQPVWLPLGLMRRCRGMSGESMLESAACPRQP